MCGFLALCGQVDKKEFLQALNLQEHRGPDDLGVSSFGNLHLGHRRLSIIDLHTHSRQPMVNVDESIVCVFNGEIYNYLEIRQELVSLGYRFLTQSDTEVLINAYHCYGEKCLDLFIGMFAFVIYDRRDDSLFVARDRLGIKPVYYTETAGRLIFSSEIKSITRLLPSSPDINLAAISSFLSYRYPISNDSFYQGINQLPPAHFMRVNAAREVEIFRYWDFSQEIEQQSEDRGEDFYLNEVRRLFKSAVEYRTIADVPVGAYLSGGVDSSAIVAEMARLSPTTPVKTFTIGFDEAGYNEFDYARIVAERYECDHHEITLTGEDYIATMEELIRIKDAPLGVPNEVPLFLMSKVLKKHITVVLSGEGADEIFGGYGRIFRSADEYELLAGSRNGEERSPELEKALNEKYCGRSFSSEIEHFLYLYGYTNLEQKSQILSDRFSNRDLELDHVEYITEIFNSAPRGSSYLSRMMYVFERVHLPGLLQRVDATTMGASVEARVPFVDHRLVEFAFTVPDRYKLNWRDPERKGDGLLSEDISEKLDIPKYLLKKSLESSLDESTLYRKKMGFPVPLDQWFGGHFRSYARDKILGGRLAEQGLINKSFVANMLSDRGLTNNHPAAIRVWMLLSLEIFASSNF